ncbi:glyoxalase/bleomycin resistance/dioxygenase family protein [Simiduia litorea]|uniref:VOC family protein n=1 Tax=Simiduia litorea TaxID=1435348 RepID=UPI0036F1DEF3
MAKVLGLGGVFFKAPDPQALIAWYNQHLGTEMNEWGAQFPIQQLPAGAYGVFSPFKESTDYFAPSTQNYMINLVVDDVEGCLAKVRAAGVEVMPNIEKSEYGSFGWFIDPAGNKIELWQPPVS